MRVYFKTFGCRVNQYETESLRERVLADGRCVAVRDFETADLCVVNTCTVTGEADNDALALLRRISRRNPAARLVVTGCLATRSPSAVREAAPAADVVSNGDKDSIPALLGCRPVPDYAGIGSFEGHSRAFVKVQDGCNMHCAYCIIPSIRPDLSCKPYGALEEEVRALLRSGYGEVVLCGIRLGRYLWDGGGARVDFPGMLERLARLEGDFRIRLSSLEITDITDRFLDTALALGERLCSSFHLPLQSGSEGVLSRMGRWYSAALYARRLEALRARLPKAGVFTDVLVGFPGESRRDFEETRAFVRDRGFSGLHVFRYSKRAGTPAARYDGQVGEAELRERSLAMRGLDTELRAAFAAGSVGEIRQVLVEDPTDPPRGSVSVRGVRPKIGADPRGGSAVIGMTNHFLRVRLDRDPGPGLHRAKITAANGETAAAVILR